MGRVILGLGWVVVRPNKLLALRLDRCDRVVQNESRYPTAGNVCLFSAATCTSQCKLRSLRANMLCFIRQRVASLTRDCNGVFPTKVYCQTG